jgi:glycosyltransferase involved in cell wall biosynthesis
MKEDPLVSVIVPCFNQAEYLSKALASVLSQTYANWELIVVDDGSTDHTSAVSRSLTDARIRYMHQENAGLSSARNAGIWLTRGELVAFLDADDVWHPAFLTEAIRHLGLAKGVVGVYCRSHFIDGDGALLPQIGSVVVPAHRFRQKLLEGGFFPVHSALVERRVVLEVGCFEELPSGRGVEDWAFWLRISEGHSMHGFDALLVYYRVYPNSMSTNAADMHAGRMSILDKHFGPPNGNPNTWTADKRYAYGFAYRATALGYIAQEEADKGWRYLQRAAQVYPSLLRRLDTYYELVLGSQPRGYREARSVNITNHGAELLCRLSTFFVATTPAIRAMRRLAFSNAYQALCMLSDQAGDWPAARRYMRRAIWLDPSLLRFPLVVRRLLKLHAGRRATSIFRTAVRSYP